MEIRPARMTDLDGIRRCAEAAYAIYVPRIGKRPAPMVADFARLIGDGKVHVLSEGGTIAGFAVLYRRGDHVHLENVAVHPDCALSFKVSHNCVKVFTLVAASSAVCAICAISFA